MAVALIATPAAQPSFHNRPQQDKLDSFDDLVVALKEALGPSSGLDSSDVDLNALMENLREYDAGERGWVPYAMADPEMNYTRNLVDEGNGKSNLVSTHLLAMTRLWSSLARTQLTCRLVNVACARVDPREGQPHPRPRQRPLHREDAPRQPDRDEIRVPPVRRDATDAADLRGDTRGE